MARIVTESRPVCRAARPGARRSKTRRDAAAAPNPHHPPHFVANWLQKQRSQSGPPRNRRRYGLLRRVASEPGQRETSRRNQEAAGPRHRNGPGLLEGVSTGEEKIAVQEHRASDYLKTPQDIAAYLNAAIEEFDGDPRLLMKAFRNVAAAQGGVSELARRAAVDRVGLSRGLSGNRDPRLGTVTKIAAACGVKIQFVA